MFYLNVDLELNSISNIFGVFRTISQLMVLK